MDDKVTIMTPDGPQLAARVIRPRTGPATLPTLLEFTLGDDPNSDLRETAAHGYVGVVAYVRSPAAAQVLVFEHDGGRCQGGHRLDHPSDLERWAGRHDGHALQRLHGLGGAARTCHRR